MNNFYTIDLEKYFQKIKQFRNLFIKAIDFAKQLIHLVNAMKKYKEKQKIAIRSASPFSSNCKSYFWKVRQKIGLKSAKIF